MNKIGILGVGSYLPEKKVTNFDLAKILDTSDEWIRARTGIKERRFASPDQAASDLAANAAERAIKDAGISQEDIDLIIVGTNSPDTLYPATACLVQDKIGAKNAAAFDLQAGCTGWVYASIVGAQFIKTGMYKHVLVIGVEAITKMVDEKDRDTYVLFGDGAGATIIEDTEQEDTGIIGNKSATYATDEAYYLAFEASYNQELQRETRYIKMNGRMIYNFALTYVPQAMKDCLDESGIDIKDLKKIFIHQANEKMDQAICERFYKLYDLEMPENVMPMSIAELGNSSVATLPTLLDLVKRKQIENQEINKGDIVLFASVGAGMNINALTYKI